MMSNLGQKKNKDSHFPSLLDKLTDFEPNKKVESAAQRRMTLSMYKAAVLRDLLWLLNTTCPKFTSSLDGLENVSGSVLNYGIQTLSGNTVSEINWSKVQENIKQVIICFEPRIDKEKLEIDCIVGQNNTLNEFVIEIKGFLKLNPYPQEFLFRSNMDLETGHFSSPAEEVMN
ncbi:type VI secretion system baseplate subunit TssE [Neisseria sp. Ec49-e6-T10]|uniref:type VI secretion system baseplate subunit TssE n=1 Tax=Neisseria sp. Ec49-e6-T10 TaxID=3140744 RepID=UPI003EBDE984